MKKKLIAFLVLVIAVCSLFTACVKTKASEALKYNGSVAEAEITETVGNSVATYNFYQNFSVESGFSVELKKGGVAQANLSAIALDEGLNTFNIVVSGNNDSANFTLKIKRNKKFTITIEKVVDGVVVEGAGTTDSVEEGSGAYTVPDSKKPTTNAAQESFVGYKVGVSTGSMGYIAQNVTANLTIYAHYATKEFAVSFDGVSSNLKYGAPIVAPTPADKDTAEWDYTFEGWKVAGTADSAIVDLEGATVSGAVDYVSVYSKVKQTYTVKFDGVEQTVEYGALATKPTTDPTKPNEGIYAYTFAGWVVDANGNGVADATETTVVTDFTVTGNVAYVAKFTQTVAGYTVKFDGVAQTVAHGEAAVAPADSTPADTAEWDYSFAGWVLDANGNGVIDNGEEVVTDFSNVTANAEYLTSYTRAKKSYSISFNGEATTLEYGAAITAPATNPTKNPDVAYTYSFAGWKKAGTADTELVTNFGTVTGAVSYVPVYNRTLRKYAVSFDGVSAELDYGSVIVAPAPADKDTAEWDYTFVGWKKAGTADSAIVDLTSATVSGAVDYVSVYTREAKGFVINLPANQVGYTLTTDKDVYQTGDVAEITCEIDAHYSNDTSAIVVTVGGVEYSYEDIYNARGVITVEIGDTNVGVTVEGVKINVYTLTAAEGEGYSIGGSLSGNALTSVTLTINYDAHYDAIVDDVVVTVGDATFSYADGTIDYATNQFTVQLVENADIVVTGVVADVYTYSVEYRKEALSGAYGGATAADDVQDTLDLTADEVEAIASTIDVGEGFEYNSYEISDGILTINFARTLHSVSFKGFDGVEIDGYTVTDVKYGSNLKAPAAPAVVNPDPDKVYTFAGWKAEGADDSTAAMRTTVTETAVYVPVYTSVDKTYTITLPATQVGYTATVDVAEGKKGDAYTITVVIDENYSKCVEDLDVFFNGVSNNSDWAFDPDTLTATYTGTFSENITVTLTGFAENVYTISYASNVAYTVSGTLSGKKGEAFEVVVTINEGFRDSFASVIATMDGFTAVADASTFTYTFTGEFALNGDMTLEISGYEQDAGIIAIEVQLEDIAGGTFTVDNEKSSTGEYATFGDTEINAIASVQYEGFTFAEVDKSNLIADEGNASNYVGGKLIVKYTRNSYNVNIYNEDGSEVANTVSVKYGAPIVIDVPEKADDGEKYYVFTGWINNDTADSIELGVMGAEELNIVPSYEEKIREYELVITESIEDVADIWYEADDEIFMVGEEISVWVSIYNPDYSKSVPVANINGSKAAFEADPGMEGQFFYTFTIQKEHTADGKLVIDIIGIEENTYAVTLPAEQVGYTASVIADSYTYGSEFKVLLSLEKEYNKSVPVVTINNVPVQADEDGYYVGTINTDMVVEVSGVVQNTYTVTGSGDLEANGYEISNIEILGENGAIQGAEFTFEVNVSLAYNQSVGSMKVYYVGANGAKIRASVDEDGIYTGTVNGNTSIVVEGLTKNVYTAIGNVTIANQDATYKRINSLSEVDYYLNGEKQVGVTDDINLTLEVGVTYSIEYRKRSTDEIIYSKEFTVEEGDEDIDLGTIYLGNYNLDGYTATASGLVCDPGYNDYGMFDTTLEGDFIAEYTMTVDTVASTEPDPAIGFVLMGGKGENQVFMNLGFLKRGLRILYSGSSSWNDRIASLESSTLISEPITVLIKTGVTLKLVRSGNVFFFYVNDKQAYAIDTVAGLVAINNNTLSLSAADNAKLIEKLNAIINAGDIRVGIFSSVDNGKGNTLVRTVTKVSAADSISHAINNSALTTYGHIYNADDYDASTGKMGGDYEYLLPGKTEYVKYTDAEGNDGIIDGVCHLDLTEYKGALANQNIKVRIKAYDESEDLNTVSLQVRDIGGEWSEVVDITSDLTVSEDYHYYTINYEVGKEYRFYTSFVTASVKTTVAFFVKDTEGTLLEGLNYTVYKKNADGTAGAMAGSGVTAVIGVEGKNYLAAVSLGEGEYIINVDGGGKAFGTNVPVTVTKAQASSGKVVGLEDIILEKNIWGNTTAGAVSTFNTTSQEDYSVTFEGLNAVSTYSLDQKLANNAIIKFTFKPNGPGVGDRAHGLYSTSGDSYYGPWSHLPTTIGDCDMYIKNHIDKETYIGTEDPYFETGLGIGSSGNPYGKGITLLNATPFNDLVDQFAVARNYDVAYDFAYARVVEEGVPYVYLLVKYSTANDYNVVAKRPAGQTAEGVYTTESSIGLQVSGTNPFYQNFTFSNFSYEASGAQALIDAAFSAEASPGAVGYNAETDTYSTTIAGNGKAYVSAVRGDKTDGIFTIEADIESTNVKAYAMRGFMMIDPATGKFVNFGLNDFLSSTGDIYISVESGNGYNYRQKVTYNSEYTGEEIVWVQKTGTITKQDGTIVSVTDLAHLQGKTLIEEGATAKIYLKAQVEGDVVTLWAGPNKDEAAFIWSGNIVDLYKNKATPGGHMWEENAELRYPTANVVAMGMYSFGDGGDLAKYTNIKVTYTPYIDFKKPEAIEEVITYAANSGITLTENSAELDEIKAATTMTELNTAVDNVKAVIDFYKKRIDTANSLNDWAASNTDFTSTLTVIASDKEAILTATNDEALEVAVVAAKFAIGKRGAQADFDAWYVEQADEINAVIESGEKTQDDFDAAKAEADAVIAATNVYDELVPSISNAKNVIGAVIDSTLGGAKNAAIAAINAVGASYELTEYGAAELAAAKTVAINALNAFDSVGAIEEAQSTLVSQVEAVATKVNNTFATVTFVNDGATYETLTSVKYGTVISVADATKASSATTDYTFAGWFDGSKVVEVVTAETLTANYTENARVYTISATNGTGYTVSVATEAANGSTVTLVITLEDKYNRAQPTVTAGSATASLVSTKGNVLTYSFTMPAENATVTVSGVELNKYYADFNLNIIRDSSMPLVAANAQVDLYIDDVLVKSTTTSGIMSAEVTAEQEHSYAIKIGSDVWAKGRFEVQEGKENFSKDVFVGNIKGDATAWSQKADGLHNSPKSQESFWITGLDGVQSEFDNVAIEFSVKTVSATEADPGFGFSILGAGDKVLHVLFMKTGFRIFPVTYPNWADRIGLEGNKAREENILDVTKRESVSIKMVRKGTTLYFFYNGKLQLQLDTTNGVKGYGFTVTDDNANGTDGVNDISQLATDLATFLAGKIKIAIRNTASHTTDKTLECIYTKVGYTTNATAIENAYTATVNGDGSAIKFSSDVYTTAMTSGKVVSGHALNVVVTNPTNKKIATLTLNGAPVDFTKTVTGATYTFTPEAGKTYNFGATYEDSASSATFVANVSDSKGGTNYVGASYILTDSKGAEVYVGTVSGASISMPIDKADTYTLTVGWTTYTAGKSVEFEITEAQIKAGTTVSKALVLEYIIWGNSFNQSIVEGKDYVRNYDENGYSITFNTMQMNISYNVLPTLSNGKMIKYSLKFNSKQGYNEALTANEIIAHDVYMKNVVGTTEFGLRSNSTPLGGTAVKGAPFTSYTAEMYNGNYDVVYDFAYAQVDNVVYFLAKLSTQSTYFVVSKLSVSAATNVFKPHLTGAANRWNNYTYSNFEYVENATTINNLISAGQASTLPSYTKVAPMVTKEADGDYAWAAVGATGAYLAEVKGDKTTGVFEISADVDMKLVGAYPQLGVVLVDPASGNMINTMFNGKTGTDWSMSVGNGNGWAWRTPASVTTGRDPDCQIISLAKNAKFNFRAIVSNNVVELFVNGKSAGYLNVYEKYSTTEKVDQGMEDLAERMKIYPTANTLAIGLYAFSDGQFATNFSNVKASYTPNTTYLASAKAAAKAEVDSFVNSEIKGAYEGYTHTTAYTNVEALTYTSGEILAAKIATALSADKTANMTAAVSATKAMALSKLEADLGAAFVTAEMKNLINGSTTVKEVANNLNAAKALASAYILSGNVTNANGEAISGATVVVSVDGTEFTTTTGSDGSYSLKVGTGTATTISVSATGYPTKKNIVFNATAEANQTQNIVLNSVLLSTTNADFNAVLFVEDTSTVAGADSKGVEYTVYNGDHMTNNEEYFVSTKLADGASLSFTFRFNGASAGRLAHESTLDGTDKAYDHQNILQSNADMYYQSSIGGINTKMNASGCFYNDTGFTATGSNPFDFSFNRDMFGGNLYHGVGYDFMYVRVGTEVKVYTKWNGTDYWVHSGTATLTSTADAQLKLVLTGRVGNWVHNYTYTNFEYKANGATSGFLTMSYGADTLDKPYAGYGKYALAEGDQYNRYDLRIGPSGNNARGDVVLKDAAFDLTKGTLTIESDVTAMLSGQAGGVSGGNWEQVGFTLVDKAAGLNNQLRILMQATSAGGKFYFVVGNSKNGWGSRFCEISDASNFPLAIKNINVAPIADVKPGVQWTHKLKLVGTATGEKGTDGATQIFKLYVDGTLVLEIDTLALYKNYTTRADGSDGNRAWASTSANYPAMNAIYAGAWICADSTATTCSAYFKNFTRTYKAN